MTDRIEVSPDELESIIDALDYAANELSTDAEEGVMFTAEEAAELREQGERYANLSSLLLARRYPEAGEWS
jgi:hypothetical protein